MILRVVSNDRECVEALVKKLDLVSDYEVELYSLNEGKDLDLVFKISDIFILCKEVEYELIHKAVENNVAVLGVNLEQQFKQICLEVEKETNENMLALIHLLATNRRFRREIINCQKKYKEKDETILVQIEGQFDSSYSLAIVNREVARALDRKFPNKVSLYPTDGVRDYKPDKKFLKRNPDLEKMYKLSKKYLHAPLVLRYTYPPNVDGMKGIVNGTTSYGWEESEFPKDYLEEFNSSLDFLPVMSPYVKKVMIDNGIKIPVFVVGLGADHILKIKEKKYPLKTKKDFKFLHISSCFPRKGIDILLDAYTTAFSEEDNVVLIIKTFPNPHNNVEELIKYYQKKNNKAEIELINTDISEGEILYLYKLSDCFVLPSRGEGFGLPAAESMLLGIPVITTAYGGQRYFCNEENSFLIDYSFEPSESHLKSPFSYWVSPKKDDLIKKMKFIYKNKNSKMVKSKIIKAKSDIEKNFSWDCVADRLISSKEKVENLPVFLNKKIKLLWISSFNTRCGIANYSEFIINNFSKDMEVLIVANKVSSEEILDKEKEKSFNVKRVWKTGLDINVKEIEDIIREENIDAVFIQHHFAFFDTEQFGHFIYIIKEKLKLPLFITFHKTSMENKRLSLGKITDKLKLADRLFVHTIKDLNLMKDLYNLVDNVTLIPQGVDIKTPNEKFINKLKSYYKLENSIVIGSFGFLRKHKGFLKLIKSFVRLKERYKNIKLLLLTSLYPAPDSQEYYNQCMDYISSLPEDVKKDIILLTDYILEEQIINYLSLLDIIVYPYDDVKESSSAAVRYGLASRKIILTTPIDMFNDIEECVIKADGFSERDISDKLEYILNSLNDNFIKKKLNKIDEYLKVLNWRNISNRLENIVKYFVYYQSL